MTPEKNERLKRHRQHQKDSENSQMVFGPGSKVTGEAMSNESERERWMYRNFVNASFDSKYGTWLVYAIRPNGRSYASEADLTLDAALRALCEANGWGVPGVLNDNEEQQR